MNVARFSADLEPLQPSAAVGALGDVDQEDSLEEPGPRVALWLLGLVTEEARLLRVAKLSR